MPIYKRRERPEVGDLKLYMGDQGGLDRHLLRGWAVADGTNGTYSLIDRFPKFGAVEDKGSQGGAKAVTPAGSIGVDGHTLSESQMPSHKHGYYANRDVGNGYNRTRRGRGAIGAGIDYNQATGGSAPHNHSATFTGNSQNNEPQHTVCVPLQYVGFAA